MCGYRPSVRSETRSQVLIFGPHRQAWASRMGKLARKVSACTSGSGRKADRKAVLSADDLTDLGQTSTFPYAVAGDRAVKPFDQFSRRCRIGLLRLQEHCREAACAPSHAGSVIRCPVMTPRNRLSTRCRTPSRAGSNRSTRMDARSAPRSTAMSMTASIIADGPAL